MTARERWVVDLQTLWEQINAIARHLQPTYEALGRQVLETPEINVDEARWTMGTPKPAASTVWGVRVPALSFYRILPDKSAEEGPAGAGGLPRGHRGGRIRGLRSPGGLYAAIANFGAISYLEDLLTSQPA